MVNAVNYFEIGTPDPEGTRAFYGSVFGFRFSESNPGGYSFVNSGADAGGGDGDGTGVSGGLWDTSGTERGAWAVFYIEVADIRATSAAAEAAGARIVLPLVDNGRIMFLHLADPSGNRFGVWQRTSA